MKQLYLSLILICCFSLSVNGQSVDWMNFDAMTMEAERGAKSSKPKFLWPWQRARADYFTWWVDGIGKRLLESFEFRPGVRYGFQKSELSYFAEFCW